MATEQELNELAAKASDPALTLDERLAAFSAWVMANAGANVTGKVIVETVLGEAFKSLERLAADANMAEAVSKSIRGELDNVYRVFPMASMPVLTCELIDLLHTYRP